jgi:hypothetical protein
VERTPQELMRGWGAPPIYKASGPDHGLGIRATGNLVEEGKKGSVVVDRGRPLKNAETKEENLGSKEGLKVKSEFLSQGIEIESGEGE